MLFLAYVFYTNVQNGIAHIEENILLEMKNYSLGFDDRRFEASTVNKKKDQKFYTLYRDNDTLFMLAPIFDPEIGQTAAIVTPTGVVMVPYAKESSKALKIEYPVIAYMQDIKRIRHGFLKQFVLFALLAVIVALLAAWYTLRPLRNALRLLEEFAKDIIHDINTPLTSIMLNLKMMGKEDDEIRSIRTSVQTIEMLHHNLDAYIKEQKYRPEKFMPDEVIEKYISFFRTLYDYLQWDVRMEKCELFTDKQAFERIVYNLLSNACKYNTQHGKVTIRVSGTTVSISNSSHGVRNPDRVFERFYKESERGLGIGLHIVDKLCRNLQIDKKFIVKNKNVTVILECKKIMADKSETQ